MKPFDVNGAFHPTAEGDKLRQLAIRGVGATVLSGGMGLVIQVFATMALARLLAPKDFGLVTMVSTFSLLIMNFGLNGFTEAIIQREELTEALASNLFWINLGASFVLSVLFAASGFLMARLYKDSRVTAIAQVLALTILLTGLSVIHLALLKRAMRFSIVSAIELLGRAISVVVSIILAWIGWGYWALVSGLVVIPAVNCVLAWMACPWGPRLPRRAPGTGAMVRFAINTYGRYSTGYFANNLDNFLVGWRLGATPLGFYKRAYDLFVLSANQLSIGLVNVAVSALSRLQNNLDQYKKYFLSALGVMAFVGMGLGGDLTLIGKDLIFFLLGPRWEESGQIFVLFGPGIGIMLLYYTHIWLHLSLGTTDRWFRWGLIDVTITSLSLLVGVHWGARGIALAWVFAYWIITLPALWYAGKPIGLKISTVLSATWRYPLASILAGFLVNLVLWKIAVLSTAQSSFWAASRAIVTSFLFLAAYLGTVVALHGGTAPIKQVIRLLREMVSYRKSSGVSPSLKLAEETCSPAEKLAVEHLSLPSAGE